MGAAATAAWRREQPAAALRALRRDADPVAVLARLFVFGDPVPSPALERALARTTVAGAVQLGIVSLDAGIDPAGEVRPMVQLRPQTAPDGIWWLASDLSEHAIGGPLPAEHVLGVGGASDTLAYWTPRRRVHRALDLGTGCGIQGFHAARHADEVVATDISPRALAFAAFNAALNAAADGGPFEDRVLELRQGSLLEPVSHEHGQYDLVVSNPPFVITPRAAGVPLLEYRDGGLAGDDVVRQLVAGVGDLLAPGGIGQLIGNWEHRLDVEWRDRVASWLPADLQVWVVQREVQDPVAYAETWARDGGLRVGSPEHSRLLEFWLDDFAARQVTAIGFGIITLRRPLAAVCATGRQHRLDDLNTPVGGDPAGMGSVVLAVLDAAQWLAATNDLALLAAHLLVSPDVTEERHGVPGAANPQRILLRQTGGLRRLVQVDTALAALVGACDGELSVGQVLGALGQLLDESVAALQVRLLPQVRQLVADLLLQPPHEERG